MVTSISNAPTVPQWTLAGTMNFSASATVTNNTFTAYSNYMLIFKDLKASGAGTVTMTLNGRGVGQYVNKKVDTALLITTGSANYVELGFPAVANESISGVVYVSGISRGTGSPDFQVAHCTGMNAANQIMLGSRCVEAAEGTQLSTITIAISAGTLTGVVEIWGRS